jgi:hypothetical protein
MSLSQHIAFCLLMAATGVVCSAQGIPAQSPASSDGTATVVQLTGQVSVLKDDYPWALQVGSTVQLRQMIVTGVDGYALLRISDGSTFEVYPNSRVTFRSNPSNWKDLLELYIGRVKVHIQKFGGQPNNNRVRTPTAIISVRGTIFDVVMEDADSTLVSVEEGQVAVRHAYLPPMDERLLNPGEYIRVYRNQPIAERRIDRGAVLQNGLRAAAEALYRIVYRNPVPGNGGGSVPPGGGTPGDSEPPAPPPPAAPPPLPPAAPPPPSN